MGLDMYLNLRKKDFKWKSNDYGKFEVNYPAELTQIKKEAYNRGYLLVSTDYLAGSWRKFSALHNFITEKFADGEDNCQEIYLEEENIAEIITICEKILENKDLASSLLPTDSRYQYDDGYFNDVEYTLRIMKEILRILTVYPDYSAIYQASW